jgi:RNA polymerase sigma-70 factor (ECF subfamily)
MSRANEDWLAVLQALLAGDRVALVKVSGVVTGFLARYRAYEQRESWDDLVQEVLIALIRSGRDGRIRDARAFVAYVGMITRNKLYDWRSNHAKPGRPGIEGAVEASDFEAPANRSEDPGLRVDLERCLGKLPDRQRSVVEAVYIQGQSYEEAALSLGRPLGSLKRDQTVGLQALRDCMLGAQ